MKKSFLVLCLSFSLFVFPNVMAFAGGNIDPIKEIFEPSAHFVKEKYSKVAVVQTAPHRVAPLPTTPENAEKFKVGNRNELARYIRVAAGKGAELIVTPEFGVVGYPDIPELPDADDNFRNRDDVKPYVETVPGPSTKFFSSLARELKVFIHFGFVEVDRATDKFYNVVVAVDPKGQIIAKYRKINLYKTEADFLSPGTGPVTYEGPFGKVGLIICADVYSYEPLKSYKKAGVNLLALSTSWAQENTGMDYFTRAAVSSNVYLLAANQIYFPDSGVISPDGTRQSHIRQSEGIAYGYVPRLKALIK